MLDLAIEIFMCYHNGTKIIHQRNTDTYTCIKVVLHIELASAYFSSNGHPIFKELYNQTALILIAVHFYYVTITKAVMEPIKNTALFSC